MDKIESAVVHLAVSDFEKLLKMTGEKTKKEAVEAAIFDYMDDTKVR